MAEGRAAPAALVDAAEESAVPASSAETNGAARFRKSSSG